MNLKRKKSLHVFEVIKNTNNQNKETTQMSTRKERQVPFKN